MMGDLKPAFLEGPEGAIYELKEERNTLGRVGGGATIEVRDKSLSREHAEIAWDGAAWVLRDLNSKNKTFHNEVPLEPPATKSLTDGDQIHLGACPLRFRTGPPKPVDVDATVAVDVAKLPFNKMFEEASSGKLAGPGGATRAAAPTVADAGSSRKAAVESAAAAAAFGYLELRSVTNPVKYYLTKKTVRIGSDAGQGCDILLGDPSIQGAHVEIVFAGGKNIKLRNMAKTGTLLNGKRVGTVPIKDSDVIDLGDSSFTFRVLKLPEVEKSGGGLKLVIVALLLMIVLGGLGVGGYYYKIRYIDNQPDAGGTTTSGGSTTSGTTTTGGTVTRPAAGNILSVIDEIKRLDYTTAAQTASRLAEESTDPEVADRAKRLVEGLDLLRKAQAEIDNRLFLDARSTVRSIPDGELKTLAADEIRRIELRAKSWIDETIGQIRNAENREEWKNALGYLEALRGHAGDLPVDPAKVRLRIDLKSRASEEIKAAARQPMAESFNVTGPRVNKLLGDIEAKTAGDETMATDLANYTRTLRDISGHCALVEAIFKFKGGDLAPIQAIAAGISPSYSAIRDVQRLTTEAEKIQRLAADKDRLIAAMGGEQDERKRLALSEQLIRNREEALSLLSDSSKYEMVLEARNNLRELRDFRKNLIVTTWGEVPDRGNPRDKQELLTAEISIRRHSFEVLSLFEESTRRKIQNPSDINLVIGDTELQNTYRSAWDAYNNAFTRATSILNETQVDTQPALQPIRDNFQNLTQALRDATLPEDDNARRRLDALRERQMRAPR